LHQKVLGVDEARSDTTSEGIQQYINNFNALKLLSRLTRDKMATYWPQDNNNPGRRRREPAGEQGVLTLDGLPQIQQPL
jgi:hypothetical protein